MAWNSGKFAFTGNAVKAAGPFARFATVSFGKADRQSNAVDIEFVTDARSFEILMKGTGDRSRMRLQVDGELIAADPIALPDDGADYLVKVDFPAKALRKIRINAISPLFAGVVINRNDSILDPVPGPHRFRAMFFGDSITADAAGPAAEEAFTSFAPIAAQLLGWEDAWISGVGSTGYLRAVPATRPTFRQRFARDVLPYKPDVLVIAGGINDLTFGYNEVNAEADLLFDQIERDLPNTLVFVLGPWNPRQIVPPEVNRAIRDAAQNRPNFFWIRNFDEPWITGTGRVTTPTGDGNSDIYTSSDGVHPTADGIDFYARKLADAIKAHIET